MQKLNIVGKILINAWCFTLLHGYNQSTKMARHNVEGALCPATICHVWF